jgi:hypothetical protein
MYATKHRLLGVEQKLRFARFTKKAFALSGELLVVAVNETRLPR